MTTTKGHEVPVQELDRVTIRFAGDSGDGMQLTGTQFTRAAAVFGNDISTLPDYPAEIRAPAGSLPGRLRLPDQLQLERHPHAGRRARRARGDEPGGPPDEPQGPGAGRRDHRQQRRLHAAQPGQGRLRQQPPRGRVAQAVHGLRDPGRHAQRAGPRGPRHDLQAGRPDQELLRPRRDVLALRAEHGPDPALDRGEVRVPPGRGRGEPARAARGLRVRRDDRDLPHPLRRPVGPPRPRHVPQHHRQRGDRARLRRRIGPGRAPAGLRDLPDHAGLGHPPRALRLQELRGQDVPGGGRDRGHRRGDRRLVRGRAGAHRHVRARDGPQGGGAGPRGDGRAAAGRRERPARRAVDRPAHQDRADRPAPGDLRPQRGVAAPGRRPATRRPSASTSRSRPGGSR